MSACKCILSFFHREKPEIPLNNDVSEDHNSIPLEKETLIFGRMLLYDVKIELKMDLDSINVL